MLVKPDGERLPLGLPPVDLGLAIVREGLIVLGRRADPVACLGEGTGASNKPF